MQPRRKQTPITIRSDRAAARLKLLTRGGRSQTDVIEEALERMPLPKSAQGRDSRKARIMAIVDRMAARGDIPSMKEFDRSEYDSDGNPR